MKLVVKLQEMAASEIKRYIADDVYTRIKSQDDNPMFAAFVVGQEGESTGPLNIGGKKVNVVKKWFADVIKKLHDKLKVGIPLFVGHNAGQELDNTHAGRQLIGEIVGKSMEWIGGKLSTIAIGYLKPAARALGLDVASIEASLEISTDGQEIEVSGIDDVTGIALGNSRFEKPGFPGAVILAAVQEFAEKGEDRMTLEEVKAFIKENKTKPSEIYGSTALKGDPIVEGIIQDETKTEYARRKKAEEKLDEEKTKWETEKADLTGKLQESKSQLLSGTLKEKIKAIIQTRKFDESETAFIEDFTSDLKVEDEAKIDEIVNAKIDEGKKKYDRLAVDVFKTKKPAENKQDEHISMDADPEDIKSSSAYKELSL